MTYYYAYLEGEKSILRLSRVRAGVAGVEALASPEVARVVRAWRLVYGTGQVVVFPEDSPMPFHTRRKKRFSVHGDPGWPVFDTSGLAMLARVELK